MRRDTRHRPDELFPIMLDIEFCNVLTELGRTHEALPILHDIIARISFTNCCPSKQFFWLRAMVGMGFALINIGSFDQAKVFFELSLRSSNQMEDLRMERDLHQQLPYVKIMRGLAMCLEAQGNFDSAVNCLRLLVDKYAPRHSDTVIRAKLNIEWCTLELRCGRNNASTLARLQEATREVRSAAKMGDHRAPALLDEAL